jgi:DNA-binding NarL/FixJ family response regulator
MGDWILTSVARQVGAAAALNGDRSAARSHYEHALNAAGKIQFRPDLALTHVQLAELLSGDEDIAARSEALKHLDIAIPDLRDMKMQPGLERALSLRKQLEHQAPSQTSGAEGTQVLTGREQEVARLLAAGRSNREIADALVISEGTVGVHVKHVLGKLGLRSRAQVAAWAAEHGTVASSS